MSPGTCAHPGSKACAPLVDVFSCGAVGAAPPACCHEPPGGAAAAPAFCCASGAALGGVCALDMAACSTLAACVRLQLLRLWGQACLHSAAVSMGMLSVRFACMHFVSTSGLTRTFMMLDTVAGCMMGVNVQGTALLLPLCMWCRCAVS